VVLTTELFRVLTIGLVQLDTQSVSHNKGISKESHIFTKNKKAPRAIPNIPQQEQIATDVNINFLSFHSSMIFMKQF
jgi:hypothetical protein